MAASENFSLPSSHQVLIVFSKRILFLAMASNAAAFLGDAVAALKTVLDLAETVPVLGNIVEALQYVKSVADTATHNKKNCAKVSKRCEALALMLESCVREYSEHGGPKRSQVHGLTDLSAGLGRMKTVVDKHANQGKLGCFLTAKNFKEEFDEVDKDIREALELVHFGLSETSVAQNNKFLENTTVIMEIDEKMDAAITHLTDICALVRELREQGGGGDVATLDQDVDERLHTLTQMIEGVQQELLADQKKREPLLYDPMPAADVAIAAAQTKYQGKKAPLCAALEAKDEDAAEALLDGGADPNEVDQYGKNALHMAAWNGCRRPLFQRFLAMVHDVNTGDNEGNTALMLAACHNHLDVVISLMNHPGIDLNVQAPQNPYSNYTALHMAVANNHPAILAQLLSDDKIDASLKEGFYKMTPLTMAIDEKYLECVKILKEHGAPE